MENRKSVEVIVIGSGPAGCAAASTCFQAGLNVLIVTDNNSINIPNESIPEILESIHPGVSSLLNQIGLAGSELAASRGYYKGIYANESYTPLGADSSGDWQGMHISRQTFNHQLEEKTKALGIQIRFEEKVEDLIKENNQVVGVKTGSADLFAKYIIDASGKNGIAGKKLHFKRKFYSPPLLCWTGVSGPVEIFPFDENAAHFMPGDNGWAWLAPQSSGYCSWTMLSTKGEKSFSPPEVLKDYPTIGKVEFGNMRWRLFRPLCSEGVILCGDAAGILDPAAGQGIFNALFSGITAANTVVSCIGEPDFASFHLAYYDDWFLQQFEMKVKKLRKYYQEHGIRIFMSPES